MEQELYFKKFYLYVNYYCLMSVTVERWKALKRDARELARDAKSLQKAAEHLPAARKKAERLQAEAESALAEAEALKLQARLEDLNVWERELVKESKKGSRT